MGASFGRVWRHDTHNQPPGVATFLAEDRALLFMRYLRKQIAVSRRGVGCRRAPLDASGRPVPAGAAVASPERGQEAHLFHSVTSATHPRKTATPHS